MIRRLAIGSSKIYLPSEKASTGSRDRLRRLVIAMDSRRTGAILLLFACLLHVAQSILDGDCVLLVDGTPLDDDAYIFGYDIDNVADTSPEGTLIKTFELQNVKSYSLSLGGNEDSLMYISTKDAEPSVLDILLTSDFPSYEQKENEPKFTRILNLQCNDGTGELPLDINLILSNTYEPVVENFLNEPAPVYNLPMPFPQAVSITAAFNEIWAYDEDVSSTPAIPKPVSFTIEDDTGGLFEASTARSEEGPKESPKIRYFVDIKAKEQLNLNSDYSFTLVASDGEGKETKVPITVKVDAANSDPIPSSFSSALYLSEVTNPEMDPGTLETNPTPITISDPPPGPDEINIEVKEAPGGGTFYSGLFAATSDAAGLVTFTLTRQFTPEELNNEVLVVTLKASQTNNPVFIAETLVQVNLPPVGGSALANFEFSLYSTKIDDPQHPPGPLTMNPVAITLENYPGDDVTVTLLQAPDGSFFSNEQFSVAYLQGGQVIVSLAVELQTETLAQEKVIMWLKAEQEGTGTLIADTLVEVDIPQTGTPPSSSTKFEFVTYRATIADADMGPGIIPVEEGDMKLLNVPDGTDITVDVTQPESGFWSPDQFSAAYDSGTKLVTLSLAVPFTPDAKQQEALMIILSAKDSASNVLAETTVYVDMPKVAAASSQFALDLYTADLTADQPLGPIPTHEDIHINNPPAGELTLSVLRAPGDVLSFETYFSATHSGNGDVVLSLDKELDSDPLNQEVIVVLIEARATDDPNYLSSTIVLMDVPAVVFPPPGDLGTFSSPIYVTQVTGPEMPLGILDTDLPIEINTPPGGLAVFLLPAAAGIKSYEDHFSAEYDEPSNIVTLKLVEALPIEAFDEPNLAMQLRANSSDDPDYQGATIIHVKIPPITCETTTCAPWPTCPPCVTSTPPPSTTIKFDQALYSASFDPAYTGVAFTVQAELVGVTGDLEYGFDSQGNDLLDTSLTIEKDSGVLSIARQLPPGHFTFRVSAHHVETGDVAYAPAIIDIRSIVECDNGSFWFEYSLIFREIFEATAIDQLIPGANDPSNCNYWIYEVVPEETEPWFTYDETTGQLSVSAESDAEHLAFGGSLSPEIRLTLAVNCDGGSLKSPQNRFENGSIAVDRQQMVLILTLLNVNEFEPKFENDDMVVGYPNEELARTLLPGPIVTLKASDDDLGDSVFYTLGQESNRFSVRDDTGSVYPVDGFYNYEDQRFAVAAFDQHRLKANGNVQIRHVKADEVAVMKVQGAVLEDAPDILEELNTQLADNIWGALQTAVVAEYDLEWRMGAGVRAEDAGKLLLVVYALDKGSQKPKSFEEIQTSLDSLESEWQVEAVQKWQAPEIPTNDSLQAAVIALGIITGLLLITLVLLVYLLVFRKKQRQRNAAKAGFKNRTSFSKPRDSVMEGGDTVKENGTSNSVSSMPENWLSPSETDGQAGSEERRRSTVTFNDRPEVIPRESVRL